MSLSDRIADALSHDLGDVLPFVVDGVGVGRVARAFAPRLAARREAFDVTGETVGLAPGLRGPAARTAAVNAALRRVYDDDASGFGRWCGELAPVRADLDGPPLFEIERAALPTLGVLGCGVHLNGFVRAGDAVKLWVARRSRDIASFPGQLDQIAAGFLPLGAPPLAKLVAEAGEEAGIPEAVARRADPVGRVPYCRRRPLGVDRGAVLVYDLELPPEFRPVNRDGEVEAFHLWPAAKVMEVLAATRNFKFDCALVAIDFLIRHGVVTPEHPEYLALVRDLRV